MEMSAGSGSVTSQADHPNPERVKVRRRSIFMTMVIGRVANMTMIARSQMMTTIMKYQYIGALGESLAKQKAMAPHLPSVLRELSRQAILPGLSSTGHVACKLPLNLRITNDTLT